MCVRGVLQQSLIDAPPAGPMRRPQHRQLIPSCVPFAPLPSLLHVQPTPTPRNSNCAPPSPYAIRTHTHTHLHHVGAVQRVDAVGAEHAVLARQRAGVVAEVVAKALEVGGNLLPQDGQPGGGREGRGQRVCVLGAMCTVGKRGCVLRRSSQSAWLHPQRMALQSISVCALLCQR